MAALCVYGLVQVQVTVGVEPPSMQCRIRARALTNDAPDVPAIPPNLDQDGGDFARFYVAPLAVHQKNSAER